MYKGFIILILLLANAALLTWYIAVPYAAEREETYTGTPLFDIETLRNTLTGIFRVHRAEDYNIRERTVPPGIRAEMRVAVPSDVSMATLNFEIHRAARAMGYRISAREDSRTGHLSIHIRDKDAIVLTVIVVRQ
jgi:hypothetical protein